MWLVAALVFALVVAIGLLVAARRPKLPPALLAGGEQAPSPDAPEAKLLPPAPPSSEAELVVPALVALRPRRDKAVVFVHGFGGFGELRLGPARAAYFRGVRERLHARGIRAAFAELPAVAPIAIRGAALARFLDELGDIDLHLVFHSMGGLDARWVVKNASPSNVRSLVTIATPHRGTPLADLGSVVLGRRPPKDDGRRLLATLAASVSDLTRVYLAEQGDAPIAGMTCASVLVEPKEGARGVRPLFRPTHRLIEALEGANDGVVPVRSQAWADVLGTVDADHCGVLGWTPSFDAASFYGALAASMLDGAPSLEAWDPARPRIALVERIPA